MIDMATRKVRFNNIVHVVSIDKTLQDRITDVQIAKDEVVHFLKATVGYVFLSIGKHLRTRTHTSPQSPLNSDYMMNKFRKAASELTDSKDIVRTVSTTLADYANKEETVRDVIVNAIKNPKNTIAHYCALVLIKLGLESFIKFNQCANKCYEVVRYAANENDYNIKITRDQMTKPLVEACLNAHGDIQDVLGIDDIRKFDNLLRIASKNRCSFVVSTYGNQLAGANKLHYGPRGGKYVVVNGKKKYIRM